MAPNQGMGEETRGTDDTLSFDDIDRLAAQMFTRKTLTTNVRVGAVTHPGKVRSRNEDHYLVVRRRRSREVLMTNLQGSIPPGSHEDAYVLVVADGIGGGVSGDFASRFAIQVGWNLGSNENDWPFRPDPATFPEVLAKIRLYPLLIHRALMDLTNQRPELKGMGTTLTGAYSVGNEAFITHVGDSRANLIRDGVLMQLTKDQTLAQYYQETSGLDPESEEMKKLSHVLISCLGAADDGIEVETRHVKLVDQDALLLCSDGLTDMVSKDKIAEIVSTHKNPQNACDKLLELALDAGGRDNITIVLARYEIAPATITDFDALNG